MYNTKLFIYIKAMLRAINFNFDKKKSLNKILLGNKRTENINYINNRVNYYCKVDSDFRLNSKAISIKDIRFPLKQSMYKIDCFKYFRYFPSDAKFFVDFGDVNYFSPVPTIVKSRPIRSSAENEYSHRNSVLLKLNEFRHFKFIKDKKSYDSKKNMIFYRGSIYQPHRIDFFEKHFDNAICDIGHVGKKIKQHAWTKKKASIREHLNYKFILSLEGNDVASNLKWIMSSNSIAIMPKPKFETWFMEGTLKADYHYIEVNSDYSNLNEKVDYYLSRPDEAKKIIEAANKHVENFKCKELEKIIALETIKKYLSYAKE